MDTQMDTQTDTATLSLSAEVHQENRPELIRELGQNILPTLDRDLVSQGTWAILWLCDLSLLEELVNLSRGSPQLAHDVLEAWHSHVDDLVKLWASRTRTSKQSSEPSSRPRTPQASEGASEGILPLSSPTRQPATLPGRPSPGHPSPGSSIGSAIPLHVDTAHVPQSSSQPSSPRARDAVAKQSASCRDKGLCIVTNAGQVVEIAHILPFSLGEDQKWQRFWGLLSMFWSNDKIERWKNALPAAKKTEHPSNLLTMSPSVHGYWGAFLFALEPISVSEDQKTLTVRFWWMRPCRMQGKVSVTRIPDLPHDLDSSVKNVKLYNCTNDQKICSKNTLTITTDHPVTRPLPSFDLLNLQWVLHRLTALQGGAGFMDDLFADYDSEEDLDSPGFLDYRDIEEWEDSSAR